MASLLQVHSSNCENLFWWVVSVELLAPELSVHLEFHVLKVIVSVDGLLHVSLCDKVVGVPVPVRAVREVGQLLHPGPTNYEKKYLA